MSLIFNRIDTSAPWFIRPVAKAITGQVRSGYLNPSIEANVTHIESELSKTGWFAGNDFTAADVQMSFPLEAASARAISVSDYPAIGEFLTRIHARPAYKAALESGGPYSILTG